MIFKYPIYGQSEGHCGPANLRSQAKFWTGKEYKEEFLSKLTHTTKKGGCSPEALVSAARNLGFFVWYVPQNGDYELLERLVSLKIPPVVCYTDKLYGNEDHWATILGLKDSSIVLADSNLLGTREESRDIFYRGWILNKGEKILNTTVIITPRNNFFLRNLRWVRNYF